MAFRSTSAQKIFKKRITQQSIVEKDFCGGGLLIFRKTLTTICQWSTKNSRLCEDAK